VIPEGSKEEVIGAVIQWVKQQMDKDRKVGALKSLQGSASFRFCNRP
jgi:hypothetical protein